MSTKNNPGDFDCYAAAGPDEPMFVLLGRDKHAAALVNLWAAMRMLDGERPAKCEEATNCANDMMAFHQALKPGLTPAGMLTLAEGLAALADMVGAVVTIEQVPLDPLAMGNYVHRVSVRQRREPAA